MRQRKTSQERRICKLLKTSKTFSLSIKKNLFDSFDLIRFVGLLRAENHHLKLFRTFWVKKQKRFQNFKSLIR